MDMNANNSLRARRRESGFSTMELITALFVFSVGIMGILQTYFYTLEQGRGVREIALADQLIQNEWQYLKAQPFDAVAAFNELPFQHLPALPERLHMAQSQLAVVRNETAPGLLDVEVQVKWIYRQGRVAERTQHFLLADKTAQGNQNAK
ncbi:MAG: hypothetical protein HYV27_13660 [Candidatus Hydrogenedentes bacterium]|nr:hypothetical protein [Candidatus Hydrogenedentota bacterium]